MEASARRGLASVNSLLSSAFGKFLGKALGSKCTLDPQRGAVMCRASIRFQFSEYGSSGPCGSTARGAGKRDQVEFFGTRGCRSRTWGRVVLTVAHVGIYGQKQMCRVHIGVNKV